VRRSRVTTRRARRSSATATAGPRWPRPFRRHPRGSGAVGADGGGRGRWYSWDWLDHNGEPSAGRIALEWQRLEAGQHISRASVRGRDGVVHGGSPGAEPDAGAAVELRVVLRPLLRSAIRSRCYAVGGRDLGIPSSARSRRGDPSGGPFLMKRFAAHSAAVRPAPGRTHARRHADPSVPQFAPAYPHRGDSMMRRPSRCAERRQGSTP
jgi:hypothetical protein